MNLLVSGSCVCSVSGREDSLELQKEVHSLCSSEVTLTVGPNCKVLFMDLQENMTEEEMAEAFAQFRDALQKL